MADWTCRCSAKNADGSRYCEGCGAENPKVGRTLSTAPKPAEGYAAQLYRDPVYPAPPATPQEVKAALAAIYATLARMGGPIPVGTCPRHPGGCGRSRPALRGPA